jgi:hypothetical protein
MGFVCKMALGVHVLVLHNDLITTHRPHHHTQTSSPHTDLVIGNMPCLNLFLLLRICICGPTQHSIKNADLPKGSNGLLKLERNLKNLKAGRRGVGVHRATYSVFIPGGRRL